MSRHRTRRPQANAAYTISQATITESNDTSSSSEEDSSSEDEARNKNFFFQPQFQQQALFPTNASQQYFRQMQQPQQETRRTAFQPVHQWPTWPQPSPTYQNNPSEPRVLAQPTDRSCPIVEAPWSEHEKSMLAAITGFFATQSPPGPAGTISPDRLPWQFISAYIAPVPSWENSNHVPRSGTSCKNQWEKMFPNHFFLRLPTGVILCNGSTESEPNGATRTSGSNASAEQEQNVSNSGSSNPQRPTKRPRKNWSDEEKLLIDELQKQYGNKWTLIASKLNTTRTATEVKNYWHHNKLKIINNRRH